MLAADANLATRDSAKIATGPGEQERADRAAVEAARTAIAMAGNRLAERSPDAVGQQGDAERAQVQAMRGAAANPATRASAITETGKNAQDLVVREASKVAAAAHSGGVAETTAAAGKAAGKLDGAELAKLQSIKEAGGLKAAAAAHSGRIAESTAAAGKLDGAEIAKLQSIKEAGGLKAAAAASSGRVAESTAAAGNLDGAELAKLQSIKEAGGLKAAAAASSGRVAETTAAAGKLGDAELAKLQSIKEAGGLKAAAETTAAAGQEVDAERAEFQSMKAAAANIATRGSAKNETGKSVKDLSVRDAEKATADKATADKATADKATADKATADKATADKATADKATADKVTADKATGDKATSAANSGRDAGATAAGASDIEGYTVTSYKDANGQEFLHFPEIRSPGKPGERMQNAELEGHNITPLKQVPAGQEHHWYESVENWFTKLGSEIKSSVERGYRTAEEGIAKFEKSMSNSIHTLIGGADYKAAVEAAAAKVKDTVVNSAGAIGNSVNMPISMEKVQALGRRALQQIPAQQGRHPDGISGVHADSINAQVQVNGSFMLGEIPINAGARVSVELASGTIGKGGSYAGKNGEVKMGVTGIVGLAGTGFDVEANVGLTYKDGVGVRVDSVSVEPVYDFDKNKLWSAMRAGYDMITGNTAQKPTAANLLQLEMQEMGRDVAQAFQGVQVAGQDLIPLSRVVDSEGNVFHDASSDLESDYHTASEGTGSVDGDWQERMAGGGVNPSSRLPTFDPLNTLEFGFKVTSMNGDFANQNFRTGWQGGVTSGVEVLAKHFAGGKLQFGNTAASLQFKLFNNARVGVAVGQDAFVAAAGTLITT
jgi:hypothetical protein